MFGSNALPHPSNFAIQERRHHPLRLTSDARPNPAGPCHYVLLHPSVQNQRCSCQSFCHNRAAPGNICDCGHQSCYHVAQSTSEGHSRESISAATEEALLERIRRLEETIHHEREVRDTALQRERVLWEGEIRILREALAPFYKSEQDMRRKLVEVEDRIEGNYDEHVRLRDRVVALDDANMALEKRVEDVEASRAKRRRVSRPHIHEDSLMQVSSSGDDRRVSDERSVYSNSSHARSPGSVFTPMQPESDEPRSSGILDLMARSRLQAAPTVRNTQGRVEEARSSGFLALDLAERLGKTQVTTTEQPIPTSGAPPPPYGWRRDRYSPPGYAQSDPDPNMRRSPNSAPPQHSLADHSPRKRKHPEHMALDVLADVSMASPMIHG